MSFYRNIASRKAKWKRKVHKIDTIVLAFINEVKRGNPKIAILDYKDLGKRILYLGERGETLLKEAVELAMRDKVIYEMRDLLKNGELR
jgi:hypothetical protein